MMPNDFEPFMDIALSEGMEAFAQGEVPVGAVVFDPAGRIMAKAHNMTISHNDPTAHAEILALRQACESQGNYRICGTTLVVTIEPCPMCMGAALNARIDRLVFGARDEKWGAAGSLCNLAGDERLNHRVEVVAGVMEGECRNLMRSFFRLRRGQGSRRGTEVVVTGSTRNRLVPLRAGHVGSNPTLSAKNFK